MASAPPAVSIGNYKGVMLCNRPFVGLAGAPKGVSAVRQAFVCGNVGDKLGTNVPISSKEKPMPSDQRPKKESALQRHRKWLADLRITKEQLEKQYLEDIQLKEDRHKRFMEREAKMRAVVRKAKDLDCGSQAKDGNNLSGNNLRNSTSDIQASHDEGGVVRPMWALTEQQAEIVSGDVGTAEVEELLKFANALDFDKYINDSEVSSLIENVRVRIAELEASEVPQTTNKAHTGKSLGAFSDRIELTQTQDDKASADGNDLASLTKSVLESDMGRTFGFVHSHKSLAAVTERRSKTALQESDEASHEIAVPPPLVKKHTDDAGSRLDGKHCVSNLPYMHRNPAV